jgi:hypothetical protein
MLDNVRYEQKILQTAKALLADAKYRQVYNLHRGHGQHVANIDVKNMNMLFSRSRGRSESDGGDGKETTTEAERSVVKWLW